MTLNFIFLIIYSRQSINIYNIQAKSLNFNYLMVGMFGKIVEIQKFSLNIIDINTLIIVI